MACTIPRNIKDYTSKYHTSTTEYEVCLYHGGCPDGITGAYCIQKLFPDIFLVPIWPSITYDQLKFKITKQLLTEDPSLNLKDLNLVHYIDGLNVVCVDVCPVNAIKTICDHACSVLVLDHHVSNEKFIMENFPNCLSSCNVNTNSVVNAHPIKFVFDMNRSGATLAYDYCKDYYDKNCSMSECDNEVLHNLYNPILTYQLEGTNRPWFVSYAEDADLYKWNLPNSKHVFTALNELNKFTFTNLTELVRINTAEKFQTYLMETLLPCAEKAMEHRSVIIQESISKVCEVYIEETVYTNKINHCEVAGNVLLKNNSTFNFTKRYNILLTHASDYKIVSELGNILCSHHMKRVAPSCMEDALDEVDYWAEKYLLDKDAISLIKKNLSVPRVKTGITEEGYEVDYVLPDFVAIWTYNFVNDETKVSLRSVGDMDVSEIASKYGGGGHKNAAGFTLKGKHGETLKSVFTVNNDPVFLS